MQKELGEIKEHIGKIGASLERSQEALGAIKIELNNILEIIYQAWLQEQGKAPNQPLDADPLRHFKNG